MKNFNKKQLFRFFILLVIAYFAFEIIFVKDLKSSNEEKSWGLSEHVYDLTIPALKKMNWRNERAMYKVGRSNKYTDIYDQEEYIRGVYCGIYPSTCSESDILETIVNSASFNCYPYPIDLEPPKKYTRGFHFDNLFSYELIQNRWDSLKNWVKFQSQLILKNNNFTTNYWLIFMGVVLHAVQDFYCHSNWVILTSYYGYPGSEINGKTLPIWEEFTDTLWKDKFKRFDYKSVKDHFEISNKMTSDREFDRKNGKVIVYGGLQTGRWTNFYWEANGQRIIPWGHRHPGDEGLTRNRDELIRNAFDDFYACDNEKEAAFELSYRASLWWIEYLTSNEILGNNREDFLEFVRQPSKKLIAKFNYSFKEFSDAEKEDLPEVKEILDTLKFEKQSIDAINK